MRSLSAIDAIQPAWNHARRMTFAPRNWRLALKITAVAFFARIGGCSGHYNNPGRHGAVLPPWVQAALVSMLVLVSVVAIVLALVIFYLSSRLQFVLFDSVLRSDTTIAPIWQRYGRATWHWIGLKVAFFAVAIVCVSPILIPLFIKFFHATKAENVNSNPAGFVVAILGFIGAIFLILLVIGIGYTLLADFGLPSMAIEGTPLGITVQRVWSLMRAEPGQVLLYLLLRFVLGIVASIVGVVAIVFGALIALIPFGAIGGVAWLSLRHVGIMGHIFMVAAWVVLGLLYLALIVLACVMVFGYVQIFFQAYALYFLGGRYSLVGAYLEPFVPQAFVYPPQQSPPVAPAEGI